MAPGREVWERPPRLDSAVTGFGVAFSAQGLHSASIPGILALDLCPSDTNKILTGESWPGSAG